MYLRDFLAREPFHDYNLCSVCILPQPAFYSQSAVCILHAVCILPLVRSLQSAVRSPQSSFYTDRKGNENGTLFVLYTFVITVRLLEPGALGRRVSNHNVFVFFF